MLQKINKIYAPLFNQKVRYYVMMGGRAGGRSTIAAQYALAKLLAPDYFRCAIMRFVLGDVRNSIYQEIIDRAGEQEREWELNIREHILTIEYGENKIVGLGFRKSSSDQKSKLKSLANYNCIIVEEADEVREEDFIQLDDSLRTTKSDIVVILLLNPPSKRHWIIKRWFNLVSSGVEGFYRAELKGEHKEDTIFIHSTYHDNIVNLDEGAIAGYERYKTTRPEHYWNMIRGLVSEGTRGRIFKDWKIIPDKEFEALPYSSYYGLDFGFTNHPTALVEIKEHNENVYLRELIYETGLTNQLIARKFANLGIKKSAEIYADSAEPKSIVELQEAGYNVIGAEKGADSVNAGIDLLLSKKVSYTESSNNMAMESQEYKWALDKNKEPINEPIDDFNHLHDAVRYGVFTKSRNKEAQIQWI